MGRCKSRSSAERMPTFSRAAARWGPTPFAYWTGPWRSMPGGRSSHGSEEPGVRTRAPVLARGRERPRPATAGARPGPARESVEDVGKTEDPLEVRAGAEALLAVERAAGHVPELRIHDPALPDRRQPVLDAGPEAQARSVPGQVRACRRRSAGAVLHHVGTAQIAESRGQVRADPVARPQLPSHARTQREAGPVHAGLPEPHAGPDAEPVRVVVRDTDT